MPQSPSSPTGRKDKEDLADIHHLVKGVNKIRSLRCAEGRKS